VPASENIGVQLERIAQSLGSARILGSPPAPASSLPFGAGTPLAPSIDPSNLPFALPPPAVKTTALPFPPPAVPVSGPFSQAVAALDSFIQGGLSALQQLATLGASGANTLGVGLASAAGQLIQQGKAGLFGET
jgi:hypothetical protein